MTVYRQYSFESVAYMSCSIESLKEHVSIHHINEKTEARVRARRRGWADRNEKCTANNVVHEKE
jgi:hypothetical protein